jgi:NADPH:quinone reductase-like Zn-dependent oxidoreductase
MAGTVIKIGPGVEGFSVGDQVFTIADYTYAELYVVNAVILAKIPKGLDLIQAALPLVTTTGNQLLLSYGNQSGPDGKGWYREGLAVGLTFFYEQRTRRENRR